MGSIAHVRLYAEYVMLRLQINADSTNVWRARITPAILGTAVTLKQMCSLAILLQLCSLEILLQRCRVAKYHNMT